VRLTLDAGKGGIIIGRSHWFISNAAWVGNVLTGETGVGVTDAEMARMFPDAGWT
jgi:hypothetical protein